MNPKPDRPGHWMYYPADVRPPDWADNLLGALAPSLGRDVSSPRLSARVRERSRVALERLAYRVFDGDDLIRLPLRYQTEGRPGPYGSLEVVAFQSQSGIAVRIEAGARAADIAARHLIEASLCRELRNLAILIPISTPKTHAIPDDVVAPFTELCDLLGLVYASRTLSLGFDGLLIIGY